MPVTFVITIIPNYDLVVKMQGYPRINDARENEGGPESQEKVKTHGIHLYRCTSNHSSPSFKDLHRAAIII